MSSERLKEYWAHQAALIEEEKAKLAIKHKIPRDEKFEKAWRIAWDQGHSSGFSEVEIVFDELIDLIKT